MDGDVGAAGKECIGKDNRSMRGASRWQNEWTWLGLACALAALVGLTNVYVGLASGITPNLSLVGVLVGVALIRRGIGRLSAAEHRLNTFQTATSATNSIATGLVFTVPALFLEEVPRVAWLYFLFVAIGGAAVGVLTVVAMAGRSAGVTAGPEADSLRALIERSVSHASGERDGTTWSRGGDAWALVAGLVGGVVTGVAMAADGNAFSIAWSTYREFDLGINPAWIALGVLISTPTATGVLVGALLKVGLLGIAVGLQAGDVGTRNGEAANLIVSAASLVLGAAAILSVAPGLRRLATRIRKGRSTEDAVPAVQQSASERLPRGLVVSLMTIALLGLGALAGLETDESVSSGMAVSVAGLALMAAIAAAALAERGVSLLGATMNPSSGMAVLVSAGFAATAVATFGPLVVGAACFVVCATSAAADLAQDLGIGRGLGTSLNAQLRFKWWALVLGAPAAAVLLAGLLRSAAVGLPEFEIPQARALDAVFEMTRERTATLAIGVVAAAAVAGGYASGISPILIGIGMLVKGQLAVALFLGAMVRRLMELQMIGWRGGRDAKGDAGAQRRSDLSGDAGPVRVALAPVVACVLGSFAVGRAVAWVVGSTVLPAEVDWLLQGVALATVVVGLAMGVRSFVGEDRGGSSTG